MSARQRVRNVLGLTFAYALLRYVIIHDVPWSNVPLYVVNKAISWSGVLLFGFSLLSREKGLRRYYGNMASAAIAAHLVLSLMVLNPAYFDKFYDASGRMNGVGETSMLVGVLGALFLGGLFVINLRGGDENRTSLRSGWGRMVLWCAAVHVAVMGYASWLTPSTWNGYLPPITLLSFGTALYFLFIRSRRA